MLSLHDADGRLLADLIASCSASVNWVIVPWQSMSRMKLWRKISFRALIARLARRSSRYRVPFTTHDGDGRNAAF